MEAAALPAAATKVRPFGGGGRCAPQDLQRVGGGDCGAEAFLEEPRTQAAEAFLRGVRPEVESSG